MSHSYLQGKENSAKRNLQNVFQDLAAFHTGVGTLLKGRQNPHRKAFALYSDR